MVKVSVVMPVYNASRFLNESVNSILNQTLDDLELICVDDGSTDNSLSILNSFEDSRIKVYSLNHQGGGNARNYGLGKIRGKYLFCMDADDILNLNALEEFYRISEEKNLDFLVFKAINYGVEKDHYFETEYQNMTRIYNKVKDSVFSYRDLGDLLFDFNVSPWCKFYNSEFIKKTGARFRENSKFHDNQFFWDMIFNAQRIYFINEFYYTRKRYNQSLTASGDKGHIDIIGVVNDIIKLFEKHNQLDRYKNQLYNLKITWITDRYNQAQDKYKREFFNKMKNDYLSLKTKEFPKLLDDNRKFIYDCAIISKNYNDFDLIKKYYSMNENKSNTKIKELTKKLNNNEKTITNLNSKINEANNLIQSKENTINDLNGQLKNKDTTITELNKKINDNARTLHDNENNLHKLNNELKNKEKIINDLNNKNKDNEKNINELDNAIKNQKKIINELSNKSKDDKKTITELNNKINENNNAIADLNNKNKDDQKTIEKLNETVENKDQKINELNNDINIKNEIIKKNTIETSMLEIKNINLAKKNDYLKKKLDSRFSFKKLFNK